MASLPHLDSSAQRSSESISRQLTGLFADTWQAVHGPAGYRYRDLTADPVPPIARSADEWSDTVSSRRPGWPRWSRARPSNTSGR